MVVMRLPTPYPRIHEFSRDFCDFIRFYIWHQNVRLKWPFTSRCTGTPPRVTLHSLMLGQMSMPPQTTGSSVLYRTHEYAMCPGSFRSLNQHRLSTESNPVTHVDLDRCFRSAARTLATSILYLECHYHRGCSYPAVFGTSDAPAAWFHLKTLLFSL